MTAPGTLMWWTEPDSSPGWSEIRLGEDRTIIVYDFWKPSAAGEIVLCPSEDRWVPNISLSSEEWL